MRRVPVGRAGHADGDQGETGTAKEHNVTQRILSISGLRGVVGDGLDPEFILRFASAFGTLVDGGAVIVSRDGRASGDMLRRAVLAGLTATGCRVLDAGIATTPTCGVLVDHLQASG